MRLVVDLQACQSKDNRQRGIGNYSRHLVNGLIDTNPGHEIVVALNGNNIEGVAECRAFLSDILDDSAIYVWDCPVEVKAADPANNARRRVAERMREHFIANLRPDVLLITSLFEGLDDTCVTSVHQTNLPVPTAVVVYDLIPAIYPSIYLSDSNIARWYRTKLTELRRTDAALCISASVCREVQAYLGFDARHVKNISTACAEHFCLNQNEKISWDDLKYRYGIDRHVIMYTGGKDYRKNIEGLLSAYALLPAETRADHQLVFVSRVDEKFNAWLYKEARSRGIAERELVVTGYVSDQELICLYSNCKVFVFPSWHEGFGMPVLEAMACGAPVIASNTSSLREVVGREDALFDPYDVTSIAQKLTQVVSDPGLRRVLASHGLERAKLFSWSKTARTAWTALETVAEQKASGTRYVSATGSNRPRLAYVSPLPPVRSGISDYSAELLPELARFYDIEVVVNQEKVDNATILGSFPTRSAQQFWQDRHRYDRVVYHFGNSEHHAHMFEMLRVMPGVVVLHDFFISGLLAHMEGMRYADGAWVRALQSAHGWSAVSERYDEQKFEETVWRYPCNRDVIAQARGVIVHSDFACELADIWYGQGTSSDWHVVPMARARPAAKDREEARRQLGIGPNTFLVVSFGVMGPLKLNEELIRAFIDSPLGRDENTRLVFAGASGEYGANLLSQYDEEAEARHVLVTGWLSAEGYCQYLAAADLAVQLRSRSRGEMSAAALDCLNYGLPTVVNGNGSMAELPHDAVYLIPESFDHEYLRDTLTKMWQDRGLRDRIGKRAREIVDQHHRPWVCAERHKEKIEHIYHQSDGHWADVLGDLVASVPDLNPDDLGKVARAIAWNHPPKPRLRKIYVDVSVLVWKDVHTGIQRVVRALLHQLIYHPPEGWVAEPVYATVNSPGYFHARKFACRFLGCPDHAVEDDAIDPAKGDVFLGLDLTHQIAIDQEPVIRRMQALGVAIWFVVYDLLPVTLPDRFPPEGRGLHREWLGVVSKADGIACISKSTKEAFEKWYAEDGPRQLRPPKISWFPLGADLDTSVPTRGMPEDAESTLAEVRKRPTFLMVGTVEPRKGHEAVVNAFEILWESGEDVALVIVGKQGWLVDDLARRLRLHGERSHRLFWLDRVSDEYLEKIYGTCVCLLMASEGEGFGLPIIEAARHDIPVIARDIPVFREVAGDNATYFVDDSPRDLADTIQIWLACYRQEGVPKSPNVSWYSWEESREHLVKIIT